MDVVERFLKYVSFETTSDEENNACPSSEGQKVLAKYLKEEMESIGLKDVEIDENFYVYGTLPKNTDKEIKTVGFISHMDTAQDASGKDVKPSIVDYKGGDILLNKEKEIYMKEKEFPYLKDLKGEKLIVTDGTTLLGADDKAGIAIIMEAAKEIIEQDKKNQGFIHGDVKIGFTPDEEIGRGADLFNVKKFNADFAYTVDGGPLGELEFENFNGASVTVNATGKVVHPGSAKDVMINASSILIELDNMLGENERPEHTAGYDGFYMLKNFQGTCSEAQSKYIIRDHSRVKFEAKKEYMQSCVDFLNKKYNNRLTLEMKDSYYNMREKLEDHMEIIELAKKSMIEADIKPNITPIRGGTDGARLSFMGLLCPNLFTGGYNFHGVYEFIPVNSLYKGKEVVKNIIKNLGK